MIVRLRTAFGRSECSPCVDGEDCGVEDGDEDAAGVDASGVEDCLVEWSKLGNELDGLVGVGLGADDWMVELDPGFAVEMEASLVGICSELLIGVGLDTGVVGIVGVGMTEVGSGWVSFDDGKAAGVVSGTFTGASGSEVVWAVPGRSQPSRESGCSKTSRRLSNPSSPFRGPLVGFCSR